MPPRVAPPAPVVIVRALLVGLVVGVLAALLVAVIAKAVAPDVDAGVTTVTVG